MPSAAFSERGNQSVRLPGYSIGNVVFLPKRVYLPKSDEISIPTSHLPFRIISFFQNARKASKSRGILSIIINFRLSNFETDSKNIYNCFKLDDAGVLLRRYFLKPESPFYRQMCPHFVTFSVPRLNQLQYRRMP